MLGVGIREMAHLKTLEKRQLHLMGACPVKLQFLPPAKLPCLRLSGDGRDDYCGSSCLFNGYLGVDLILVVKLGDLKQQRELAIHIWFDCLSHQPKPTWWMVSNDECYAQASSDGPHVPGPAAHLIPLASFCPRVPVGKKSVHLCEGPWGHHTQWDLMGQLTSEQVCAASGHKPLTFHQR